MARPSQESLYARFNIILAATAISQLCGKGGIGEAAQGIPAGSAAPQGQEFGGADRRGQQTGRRTVRQEGAAQPQTVSGGAATAGHRTVVGGVQEGASAGGASRSHRPSTCPVKPKAAGAVGRASRTAGTPNRIAGTADQTIVEPAGNFLPHGHQK